MTRKKGSGVSKKWHLIDLHVHTPASNDYQEPQVTYLDILRQSAERGLEIIAITDHNTVAGFRRMQEEVKQLELLETLGRLAGEEGNRLKEYRQLCKKVLVLPGFEFTATFGFHILAIFSPEKDLRELEHLLLDLNIAPAELDRGSSTVGATTDVITAYRKIDDAGGLVIAAHANSSNGVAMRGFPFGGQTKIAYTQDPHLHALEVTDLGKKGRGATSGFFSGIKPEYPRRMHCIQGSDAHRLLTDPINNKNVGVGDRATEVLLASVSFEGLHELFLSHDFARTRPHRPAAKREFDFVQRAREDGATIVQDFHESMTVRGGRLYAIIADICAFANTNGGIIYIGAGADPKKPPIGVSNAKEALGRLENEISKRINPPLKCQVDTQKTQGKTVLRVLVPRGEDPPYAVDDNKVYLRDESDTGLAVRDEIVTLVRRGLTLGEKVDGAETEPQEKEVVVAEIGVQTPRTGVEVVEVVERGGVNYYTMRDLRNGNVVKNVTKTSARRLWHYAISQYISLGGDLERASVAWQGDLGLVTTQRRGNLKRYDLAQRTPKGIRLYYGVTEDGVHGEWKRLVGSEND